MSSFLSAMGFEGNIPAELHERVHALIKTISVKKGETLQRKGDQSPKGFFVKKGILRSYTIDQKGKEHVFMFGSEGWIVSDMELQSGDPASLYIDALEDSEIEIITPSLIIELVDQLPHSQLPSQMKRLRNRIAVLQKRVIMLISASALERYEDFVQTYPEIIQRVPQKMIASYLGVTPEALSKIKSEDLQNK